MSSLHESLLAAGARMIELHGYSVPEHFGDIDTEYQALHTGAGLLDLSLRVRLRVTGSDRAKFLQNMLTNDVEALRPGHGCHAVKLNVQGKMEAALHVLCLEDEMWCDLEPGAAELVVTGLRKRIILEDTEIEDVSGAWMLLSVQGPGAEAVLNAVGVKAGLFQEELQHGAARIADVPVRVVRSDHCGEGGFDIWVRAASAPEVWENLQALKNDNPKTIEAVGLRALDMRRIEAGIPWQGTELTLKEFPQEAGLNEGWISYTKGCYLGQETISRLHHMGHVNRHLRGLLLDGEAAPARGSVLRVGDKDVGTLTSVALSPRLRRPVALGYVHRDFASPGTRVVVEDGEQRRSAEVTSLPMA